MQQRRYLRHDWTLARIYFVLWLPTLLRTLRTSNLAEPGKSHKEGKGIRKTAYLGKLGCIGSLVSLMCSCSDSPHAMCPAILHAENILPSFCFFYWDASDCLGLVETNLANQMKNRTRSRFWTTGAALPFESHRKRSLPVRALVRVVIGLSDRARSNQFQPMPAQEPDLSSLGSDQGEARTRSLVLKRTVPRVVWCVSKSRQGCATQRECFAASLRVRITDREKKGRWADYDVEVTASYPACPLNAGGCQKF